MEIRHTVYVISLLQRASFRRGALFHHTIILHYCFLPK